MGSRLYRKVIKGNDLIGAYHLKMTIAKQREMMENKEAVFDGKLALEMQIR